jgi:CubicO group peptidase (beta-lactamase class C family)
MRRLFVPSVVVVSLLAVAAAQSPAMRDRMSATIRALNGPPEEFEAYAKDGFARSLLDHQTAEQRRTLFDTIRTEYGTLQPGRAARENPMRVRLSVTGSKKNGVLILEHDEDPPHRLTGLAIEAAETSSAAPASMMSDAEAVRLADAYVAPLASGGAFSGAVLVAKKGTPVFAKAYGLADRGKNIAATADTRFNVGSINKQFTRVALALLAASGKLSLDDPVEKHLADYPNAAGRKTTIRQLVTHQGGLPEWRNDPDFVDRPKSSFRVNRDFYRIVASKPLRFVPGARTEYCNSCFVVLGEIIERVAGMPYERFVQERVLARASMTSSGFFLLDEPQARMAVGYTRTERGLVPNVDLRGAGGNAAGGAFVTPGDLLAFEQAVRSGRLLDPQWTAWFLDNRTHVFFGGGGQGVSAALVGDGEWTVVVMANLDTPAGSSVAKALFSQLTRPAPE